MLFPIFFLGTITIAIIRPFKIKEGLVGLLAIILFLLAGLIGPKEIFSILIGTPLFRPLEIIATLLTLSVVSTSLNEYGFFKYAAYKVITWSKNNGKILFRNFFILTVIITAFTSNDIDVLTLTPILIWFATITGIEIFPYIFSVFVVANTSSLEILIGNLTNIVVGNFFRIGFIDFFLTMALPTIITLIVQYHILKLLFRSKFSDKLVSPNKLAEFQNVINKPLPNKKQNTIAILTLLGVIIGSAVADFFSIKIWIITLMGAIIILISNPRNILNRVKSLPWNVAFFALVLIVLSSKLITLQNIVTTVTYIHNFFNGSIFSEIFFSGYFSGIASGFINNIPASITLSALFSATAENQIVIQQATAYGLVIGTNLGALLTPIGALATILWVDMLRVKGIKFSIRKFIIYGVGIGLLSIAVACAITGLELIISTNL